jgi:hypothetical protein
MTAQLAGEQFFHFHLVNDHSAEFFQAPPSGGQLQKEFCHKGIPVLFVFQARRIEVLQVPQLQNCREGVSGHGNLNL